MATLIHPGTPVPRRPYWLRAKYPSEAAQPKRQPPVKREGIVASTVQFVTGTITTAVSAVVEFVLFVFAVIAVPLAPFLLPLGLLVVAAIVGILISMIGQVFTAAG
jgi:hypothetical protein